MVDYRVQLDAFEGPLDLLLFLIRRAEVDVTEIPIAEITDQYLAYLTHIDRIDIDTAGEFLVMAATLMEIKSRMLMPPEERPGGARSGDGGSAEGADADPRADLIRQLLEYKRYRDAADRLEEHRRIWEQRFPAAAAPIDKTRLAEATAELAGDPDDVDTDDLDIFDLVEAFARIVETVNFDRLGEHTVTVDDTPIELHAADILDRLQALRGQGDTQPGREPPAITFRQVFEGRSRSELVGLFLAILELVKQQRIAVTQLEPSGDAQTPAPPPGAEILLQLKEEPPAGPADAVPAAEVGSSAPTHL